MTQWGLSCSKIRKMQPIKVLQSLFASDSSENSSYSEEDSQLSRLIWWVPEKVSAPTALDSELRRRDIANEVGQLLGRA